MIHDSAQMAGEVQTGLNPRALAARLRAAGLRAEVRESSHYEGGHYVRIREVGDFTLERIADGEYLARADADSVEPVLRAASRVSAALTGLGIRHRFEVYDGPSEMVDYRHYLWPRSPGA